MCDASFPSQDTPASAAVGAVNPIAIVFINFLFCAGLGILAHWAQLGSFLSIGLGWLGGSLLTVTLTGIYALSLPPETDKEGDTDLPLYAAGSGLEKVIWTWDMDRSQDLARDAAIRAWEEDTLAELSPHRRHPGLPLA